MKLTLLIYFFCMMQFLSVAQDKSVPFTLDDRDRIIRMEQRLDAIEKRFEQIDKRFEQVDKRLEELRGDMNARFEQQTTYLMITIGLFTTITAATIGFALWDRRTMIRPFETKIRNMEEEILFLKKDNKNLLESLKELAKTDTKLAEILKQFNIL